jgi:leucyl-tRNA synthetase
MDLREIESKWQKVWAEQKTFEPQVKLDQKKFLCTFPYPYVNGRPHVGHLFTMMRVEAFARYKRAQGFNVLFPQGWHCTGSPIVTAAKRVADGEPGQIQILKDFGVLESEIPKFAHPEYWIEYFAPRYKEDIQHLGMSIDWRREFITTSLNPRYDKFIRWQFKRLKEKGLVELGKHPVVWCPNEQAPVSDHARRSGEGETPQEYVLILFKLKERDAHIVVATLRPETIDGVTNIWVNPAIEYVQATVDGQHWIVSKECATKLAEQEHEVKITATLPGKELIGLHATGPSGHAVPLLPASFPKADKGSGIVMSVPSDAPDDYIALRDLQRNDKQLEQYKLHHVKDIKIIPIIDAGELGHQPAVKVVEDMKINNQNERDKLDIAKKLVYKKGFYEGVMLTGDFKGEKVEKAKEEIKQQLLATNQAKVFYELTGPVVCRCLTPCVVKIVSNQWFITYGDKEWKQLAHQCLDNMRLYPDKSRQQFDYVIDWLHDWAATRAEGLGTRLPWDEHWLIESLSDSTLYNAYYTIVDQLRHYPEDKITDELFDYVFLGKGTAKDKHWEEMHTAFNYWYPVDFRNSGKDLIQNHLTFMMFTHAALLPEDKWPKGYGVNGWVTVDGQKMSKSLGNMIPVAAMVEQYGADASRLTILNGGEGLDDPNWDTELAKATQGRFTALLELCKQYNKGRDTHEPIDDWFASKLNSTIKKTTEAMELTNFRQALQHAWFDLGNTIKQYLKLTNANPHRALFSHALEAQLKMLQPFTPHISEEAWHLIGKHTLISVEHWPTYDERKINPALELRQQLIEQLAGDIRNVQQMLKLQELKEVTIIVAAEWKYGLFNQVRAALQQTRDPREVIQFALKVTKKEHGGDVTKIVPMLVKDPSKLPAADLSQEEEFSGIQGAVSYLENAFHTKVTVMKAEDSAEQKAKQAVPGKPAILLS